MKPRIGKGMYDQYYCTIPEDCVPDDSATVLQWYAYSACGAGDSVLEAYLDWLKECDYRDDRVITLEDI